MAFTANLSLPLDTLGDRAFKRSFVNAMTAIEAELGIELPKDTLGYHRFRESFVDAMTAIEAELGIELPKDVRGVSMLRRSFVDALTLIDAEIEGGGTPTPTPGPTLTPLSITGGMTEGQAVSDVILTGATDGSSIAFNIPGISVANSGTSRVVIGTPAMSGTLNAIETLAGATNSPRGTNGIATIAAAPLAKILDGIATSPHMIVAGSRTASTGQTGPIASVAVGSGTPFDVTSAAQADAGGATKLVGFYDPAGNLYSFDTRLDYVNDNGMIAGENTGGADRVANFPTVIRTALAGATGFTAFVAVSKTVSAMATAAQFIAISSDTSTTTTNFNLSSNAQGNPSMAYRRVHADTAVTRVSGGFTGSFEILDGSVSYNEAGVRRIRTGRWGAAFYTDNPATADGSTFGGTPLAASIRCPIGHRIYGFGLWKNALSDTDIATLRSNLKSQFAEQYATAGITDGAATWWSRNAARSPDGSKVVVGYGTTSGLVDAPTQIMAAEFENSTRRVLHHQAMDVTPLYTVDAHDTASPAYTPSGKLLIWTVAHNNAIDGTSATANRIKLLMSSTGRLKDLDAGRTVTLNGGSASSGANYAQPIIISETHWLFFTNQDGQVAWRALRYPDGNPDNVQQTVNLVSGVPAGGGGQNQLYLLVSRLNSTTVRFFFQPHPSNVRNLITYADMNLTTGDVTVNGVSVGNLYSAYVNSTPLINLASTTPPVAYDPGAGNSFRLMDAVGDEIYGVKFVNADNSNPRHIAVVGGVEYDLGAAGAPFGTATVGPYFPGIMRAREPHSGRRFYRVLNDGSFTGVNTLERMDMASLGAAITRTAILTEASKRLTLPLLVENAGPDFAGVVPRGSYTHFNQLRTALIPFAGGTT